MSYNTEHTSETVEQHLPCDDCGSSDALTQYTDHTYCFACNTYKKTLPEDNPHLGSSKIVHLNQKKDKPMLTEDQLLIGIPQATVYRGVTPQTANKYGVRQVNDGKGFIKQHVYPLHNSEGKVVATKTRFTDEKKFLANGDMASSTLFGQSAFPAGSFKYLCICEGELDALSAYQLMNGKNAVVSIKNGAPAAKRELQKQFEWVNSFPNIVLMFDQDEIGRKAAEECAKLFEPNKVKVWDSLDPELKDPNDFLTKHKASQFNNTFWRASQYTPAGIIKSSELIDRIINKPKVTSLPTPWDGLNSKIFGHRRGEMLTVTANTGVGKTQVLREMVYNILQQDPEAKIGTFFIEETPIHSGEGLASIHANVPFHLPDSVYNDRQLKDALQDTLGDDRVYFYDGFGSNRIDDIVNRARYYVNGLGCKYLFLDHLSIIVSDQSEGDERKLLDEIATKLKTMTVELDVHLVAVIHTNRQGQIRGTAGVEQLSNIVMHLDRDTQSADPVERNTLNISVWKNRFSGRTGPACALQYNKDTGRLTEKEMTDDN